MEKRAILPEIAQRVVVLQEVVEAVTSVEKRAILLEIAPREVQVVAEEGGHVINVEKRATLPEIVPVVVVPGAEAVISVEKRVILPGTVHPVVITGINLCLDLIRGPRSVGTPTVISLSVQGILSVPLAQSGSFFTYRSPLGKGCTVTLNDLSWSYQTKPKIFFLKHIYSPFNPIWLILHVNRAFWLGVCSNLELNFKVKCEGYCRPH